jgi:hypothetical protein
MCRRVDVVLTNVSEERIASIFRVKGKIRKSASEETVRACACRLMSEYAGLIKGLAKIKINGTEGA